jgi:hypothetical protein
MLLVLSVIIFFDFTWTLYRFSYYLPSWLGYLSTLGTLVVAAYTLSFALLESLVFLVFLVFLSLVFPSRFFQDKFVPQGSALTAVLGSGAFFLQRKIFIFYSMEMWQLAATVIAIPIAVVVLVLISSFLLDRFKMLPRLANTVADRMTLFAWIYIPLGLLGLVVVVLRNLF